MTGARLPPEVRAAREALRTRLEALLRGTGDAAIARLDEALTHPSYANESRLPDNQRLEFLGDSVLGLCVSELLVQSHPDADEGTLTRMRSALVNASALAAWARREQIGPGIALGRGAQSGGERDQTNVLADAVEAIVAAVYAARGMDGACALVREVVREPMAEAAALSGRDPKSALQEKVQAEGRAAPAYRVLAIRGPKHATEFDVEVLVDGEVLARGAGRSKRLAERAAAAAALAGLAAPPAAHDAALHAPED